MSTPARRYPPPPFRRPEVVREGIPSGLAGTRRTLTHIAALIRAGAGDFYVRQHAIDVLLERGVLPKDYFGEIRALFEWVQTNVRYTKDPFRIEVLHSARRMLELRAGDCDDMVVVLGAMLEAIGHPVRLVLTGPDASRRERFTHIYLEVCHQGRWIPLDATMPHAPGWAPRTPVRAVIPIERSARMASATAGPDRRYPSLLGDRLTEFLRAVEEGRLSPGDERVRGLSRLLADRGFLSRSPWLRAVIRYMWDRGLPPCPHPRTARRITSLLRRWSLLATTPAAPAKAHASGSGDAVPAPDSAAGVGTAGRSPDGAEGAGSPSARSIPTGGSADDGWGDQARPSSPVALRVLRPAAFRVAGKARPANLRRVRPLYPQGLAAPAPEG